MNSIGFLKLQRALAVALLAAACAIPDSAFAQEPDKGWYMGASFGTTKADIDNSPLTALGATVTGGDDGDSGIKIYGGYQFNRHLGVEVGYVDFGSFSVTGNAPGPFTANFDVTAFTGAAVGSLPLNERFTLFGKAGLYAWDAKASVTGGGLAASDTTGSDLFLGVGLRYNINRNLGVQAEIEQFLGEDTITMTTVGLRYKF